METIKPKKKNYDILKLMHDQANISKAKFPNPSTDKKIYIINEHGEWILNEEEKPCKLCDYIEMIDVKYDLCERCINIINGLNRIEHTIITCEKCNIIKQCMNCFLEENNSLVEEMSLNDNQTVAIFQLRNLFLAEKSYGYCIFGFAGSGKTYIITSFLGLRNIVPLIELRRLIYKYAISNDEINLFIQNKDLYTNLLSEAQIKENPIKISCCAPTNKATNVIKQNIEEKIKYKEFKKNISSFSLHKLLQYKASYTANGEKEFIRKVNPFNIFYNNDIIVIDESSMIRSTEILEIIKDLGKEFDMKINKCNNETIIKYGNQLFVNNKTLPYNDNTPDKYAFIVFLGDDAQLPPYSENNSLVFKFKLPIIQLNQIMRTKSDGIKYISNRIRNVINKGLQGEPETLLNLLLKYVGNKYDNIKFMKKEESINYFTKNLDQNIFLCWTHKNRQDIINKIRNKLFTKKDALNRFNNGEYIIFNDFYQLKTAYCATNFYNSTNAQIVSHTVTEFKYELALEKEAFKEILDNKVYSNIDPTDSDIDIIINIEMNEGIRNFIMNEFNILIKKINDIHSLKKTLEYYEMRIKYKNDKHLINVVVDRDKYNKFITSLKLMVKSFIDEHEYKNYKYLCRETDFPQVKNMLAVKLWEYIHNRFIGKFASVDYAISITIDSSQGSSFFNVFIDYHDVFKQGMNNESIRRFYTGITRAMNELIIVI